VPQEKKRTLNEHERLICARRKKRRMRRRRRKRLAVKRRCHKIAAVMTQPVTARRRKRK
jgi:hypothetical protein